MPHNAPDIAVGEEQLDARLSELLHLMHSEYLGRQEKGDQPVPAG